MTSDESGREGRSLAVSPRVAREASYGGRPISSLFVIRHSSFTRRSCAGTAGGRDGAPDSGAGSGREAGGGGGLYATEAGRGDRHGAGNRAASRVAAGRGGAQGEVADAALRPRPA